MSLSHLVTLDHRGLRLPLTLIYCNANWKMKMEISVQDNRLLERGSHLTLHRRILAKRLQYV